MNLLVLQLQATDLMKFKYPWRPYQQRVLNAIQAHLSDKKLHIIAPPGSGKTSLGLEIFRRLKQPALALSPTRVIRDQWILRLQDFLDPTTEWPLSWVSFDLEQPKFFTSITYQSLHAKGKDQVEDQLDNLRAPSPSRMEALARELVSMGVKTIILDECHHLKAAWWKSLTHFMAYIPDLTLVSLTATPPLDGKFFEWRNYLDLCGPIDEEIGVPELVKAETLCPHQDFLWAVKLPTHHHQDLEKFAATINEFLDILDADLILFEHMLEHPWRAEDGGEKFLQSFKQPELIYAVMVYWNAKEISMPTYVQEWLAHSSNPLPALDVFWWQILLREYLFNKDWPHTPISKKHRDQLAKQLRTKGLLFQRELRLTEARPIKRMLSLSSAKMDACLEIYRLEFQVRGSALRQVFLTDYIRDETPVADVDAMAAGLGAWPLFYTLTINAPTTEQQHMALLTGRKSVIHRDLWPLWCEVYGEAVEATPLPEHPDFIQLPGSSAKISVILTAFLAQGKLKVLVGTRSLLGEGWDAPSVNSLVIASFIGSYVTTNQMRGRAIRVNPQDPSKWASIWHLVTVDDCPHLGLLDFQDLERRFETFAGIDAQRPRIENSLARMRLPFYERGIFSPEKLQIQNLNELMVKRFLQGHHLADIWQHAINRAIEARMVPSVSARETPAFKGVYLQLKRQTKRRIAPYVVGLVGLGAGVFVLSGSWIGALMVLGLGITSFLKLSPDVAQWKYLQKRLDELGTPTGLILQIGKALREALCLTKHLKQPMKFYRLHVSEQEDGKVFVSLVGGDFFEQSLFADCMETLVKPAANPRYLLHMKDAFWRQTAGRSCYAVPKLLGSKKALALMLHKSWEKYVGEAELKFTHLAEGRDLLLKIQMQALADGRDAFGNRVDRWL